MPAEKLPVNEQETVKRPPACKAERAPHDFRRNAVLLQKTTTVRRNPLLVIRALTYTNRPRNRPKREPFRRITGRVTHYGFLGTPNQIQRTTMAPTTVRSAATSERKASTSIGPEAGG